MNAKLDDAIRDTPPPPCVGCQFAAICKDYQMACNSFAWYIGHGDNAGYEHRPMGDDELPTDATYLRCFPEDDPPDYKAAQKHKRDLKFLGAVCA